MKKALCVLAAALLIILSGTAGICAKADANLPEEVINNPWYQDMNARLKVGNPTPMRGRFFTTLWGGSTSDLDVQDLLHAYSPILWDGTLGRFRFDRSVVDEAVIMNDEDGNRVYNLILFDDLVYSDGTKITARDYAFSMLLQMDRAVAETGGRPGDCSWLLGSDEYLSGEAQAVSGIRIIADNMLRITMKAESLPYFHELNRLNIHPYPISEIAPGTEVRDDGNGAYLTQPLTAETLRETVLDEKNGYLSHPRTVSGPYILISYDGTAAKFAINPLYKGNEQGMVPRIGEIEYRQADNSDMISRLKRGDFDLLNKVTVADNILSGIRMLQADQKAFAMDNEARTGLTMIWFEENSETVQDPAVRQAIAYCFDRDAFVREYVGPYGLRTDGMYGLGQWMYRTAAGLAEPPAVLPENPTKEEQEKYDAALEQWESISLDGLTVYEPDTAEAIRLLEEAGWNLNESGEPFDPENDRIRYKKTGETLAPLRLTMAVPLSDNAMVSLKTHLTARLREAGIVLTMIPVNMETLQEAYAGKADGQYDMLYLGENFSIIFDPEILAPKAEDTALSAVRQELYELAQEMTRTEPEDLTGYARKWVALQERITETLPLIPVYSNVYFDFFTRRLHNYRITEAVTWGEAIVSSYVSDIEEQDAQAKEEETDKLKEMEKQFEEIEDPEGL